MNNQETYETIKNICQQTATKILSGSSLESFLKLDIKSQILGLKVFAYTGHEFEVLKELENLEMKLGSLPTCD
jgi:hypothetical protein